MLPEAFSTALRRLTPRALLVGLVGALLLAVPDLLRQLPVRDDPSYAHALLVDVVGVVTAAVLQLALVGRFAGRGASAGPRVLLEALRARPGVVVGGMALAGAVSALLTLVPSVALLGFHQVLGPLQDPPLRDLVLAQLSDVVATAVTAPWWALLVGVVAASAPRDRQPAGRP